MEKSRDEVYMTLERWNFFRGPIQAFAEDSEIKRVQWYFQNGELVSFEKPDAYIRVGNNVLIIEHFAIDGYTAYSGGGSELQRNQKKLDREFEKYSEGKQSAHRTSLISTVNSYQGFIVNCKAGFCKHYQKIQSYKDKLKEKGIADENTAYTVCFLMEDVSPLGTLTCDGEKMCPVVLAYSKEFLDFYSDMHEVDWVISAISQFPSGYSPYLLSHAYIQKCRENILDYANYQFLEANCMRIDVRMALDLSAQE